MNVHRDGVLWFIFQHVGDLPIPSPETVRAARSHLARRHAEGVAELLWQEHGRPLPDVDAIDKSIASVRRAKAAGEPTPPATDLVAALVVLRAARHHIDRLEVALVEAVRDAGLGWEAIAAGLELPTGDAAQKRYAELRPRAQAPFDDSADPPAPAESGGGADAGNH
jgi:hypothetical protein